jgi:magnesium chelatase subunit D
MAGRRRGQSPLIVLMTDGRANISRDGASGRVKALEDAVNAGRQVRAAGIAALAIDTAPAIERSPEPPTLVIAAAMNARYVKLPNADAAQVLDAVRAVGRSP